MGKVISCIAIDDEPPALSLIKGFILKTPELVLKGSFLDATEALDFIRINDVDLLFLDIQMPDLNGIEFAKLLSKKYGDNRPSVIFITAFVDFAVDGFKVEATDYILKPYNYQSFLTAVQKVLKWHELKALASRTSVEDENYIFLRADHKTVKVDCAKILYIEGLKDYARIHFIDGIKSIMSLITLKALEDKLPEKNFLRMHKSYIVALNKITSVTRNMIIIGPLTIPVSAPYKEDFEKFISGWKN